MKKILKITTLCISFVFFISMNILFINQFKINVEASGEPFVESERDIYTNNINSKLECLKKINKNDLKYSKELSDLSAYDIFLDSDSSVYMYDNDKLISYTINHDFKKSNSKKINQIEALKFAKKYLNNLVENSNIYILDNILFDKYLNEYCISYVNYVAGIKSTDLVYLEIGTDGKLNSYNIQNKNKFNNIILNESIISNGKLMAEKILKNKFNNILTNFEFTDTVLTIDEYENFCIMYNINYNINTNANTESDTIIIKLDNILN